MNLSLSDVYFILFRYKWVIAICGIIGMIVAVGIRLTTSATFVSEAKLFVRYLLQERRLAEVTAEIASAPGGRNFSLMASEIEMLTSLDLAAQVADTIGPEKVLAAYSGGSNRLSAAGVILSGLTIDVPKGSSVIRIMCRHRDRELSQTIASNVIESYLRMHAKVHRELGALDSFLSAQSDIHRSRLNQTEDQLKALKVKAGGSSIGEFSRVLSVQIADLVRQIYAAETELALREPPAAGPPADTNATSSEVRAMEAENRSPPTDPSRPESPAITESQSAPSRASPMIAGPQSHPKTGTNANAAPTLPDEEIKAYKRLLTQLESVQNRLDDALLRLKPEHAEVISLREALAQLQKRQSELETRYPGIAVSASALATSTARGTADTPHLASSEELRQRITVLTNQLARLRQEAAAVDEVETDIKRYERQRDLQAAQLSNYVSAVEGGRLQESLGSGRVANISILQSASPARPDSSSRTVIAAGILGGALCIGFCLAFLMEILLVPSVKRDIDVERKLKLPLFLTMPLVALQGKGGYAAEGDTPTEAFKAKSGERPSALKNEDSAIQPKDYGVPPWDPSHELREHYETLRDRLILYFESNNMTHKPKMVAVTGCNPGAGTTTLAAGLAAVLSETGEGNVLLVDMNTGQGAAHPFFHGKPALGIFETVSPDKRIVGQLQDNLFMASLDHGNGSVHPARTSKYLDLMPKLKGSDFDYIVFDLPAVSQTSLATRLAGFMDKILLVVEAEKTTPDAAKRALAMLSTSHDRISAVLNKTRRYLPQWLDGGAD